MTEMFIPPETEDKLIDVLLAGKLVGNRESMDEVAETFEGLMEFPDTMVAKLFDFLKPDGDGIEPEDEIYQECDEIIMNSALIDEEDEAMREAMSETLNTALNDLVNKLEMIYFKRGASVE